MRPVPSSRTRAHLPVRVPARLRGAAVLLACALLPAPALLAVGGTEPGVEDAVLSAARAQVGDGYRWAGNGPDAWDCSGLTAWAWREAGGVALPRTSAAQQAFVVPLPREQLLPGDLVFWGDPVSHVALYTGDGRVVDASSSRNGVLERGMWSAPVVRYGRVPREGMPAVQPWAAPSPSPGASSDPEPGGSAPSTSTTADPASAAVAPSPSASASPATSTPVAAPAPAAPRPSAGPASPAASPAASPVAAPSTAPAVWREPARLVARAGLPARPAAPSARAARAVRGARSVTGSTHFTSTGLVREAWRHAGGGLLPSTGPALVARGRAVPLRAARVGDVVSYGGGAQLYLYVGSGYMVGHSARHRKVVVRRVHEDPTLRLVRLPG